MRVKITLGKVDIMDKVKIKIIKLEDGDLENVEQIIIECNETKLGSYARYPDQSNENFNEEIFCYCRDIARYSDILISSMDVVLI